MRYNDRQLIIKHLDEWALWVRDGRTIPNALGYPSKAGPRPAKPSNVTPFRNTRQHRHWECTTCQRLSHGTRAPVSCSYCCCSTFVPVSKQMPERARQTGSGRIAATVPTRFRDDAWVRRIDGAVCRLERPLRDLVHEVHVNHRSIRDAAAQLSFGHQKAQRLYAESLSYILGVLVGWSSSTGQVPVDKSLTL